MLQPDVQVPKPKELALKAEIPPELPVLLRLFLLLASWPLLF